MINFRILSVGWDCPNDMFQTLRSIEAQTYAHYSVHIVDDASPEPQPSLIKEWVDSHDERWTCDLANPRRGIVQNQYLGVRALEPDDEDVIVFLDLDGDRFIHARVLERLNDVYESSNTLMTYGSYRNVSDPEAMPMSSVTPYPQWVVDLNAYRTYTIEYGTRFNHLRTVKWKVLKRIPLHYYKWPDGAWLQHGSDYLVMMGSLEISGGRYQCLEDVLVLYNDRQPHPDNKSHLEATQQCSMHVLHLPPLSREF